MYVTSTVAVVSQVPSKPVYHMLNAAHRGFNEPNRCRAGLGAVGIKEQSAIRG